MSLCDICDNYSDLIELSCDHEFCSDCLIAYITVKMNDGDTDFYCPSCDAEINRHNITNLNDSDLLIRFDKINLRESDFEVKNFVVCIKCKHKCKKDPDSHEITCQNCYESFCYVCGSGDPHVTCPNESKIEADLIELGWELSQLDIKACPLCRIVIEREMGCQSMKCQYCKLKFCWGCLKSSSEIKRMKDHTCERYLTFHETNSDDEYTSGSDIEA